MDAETMVREIMALHDQGRDREKRLAALEKFALELGVKVFEAKIEDLREAVRDLQERQAALEMVVEEMQRQTNELKKDVEAG